MQSFILVAVAEIGIVKYCRPEPDLKNRMRYLHKNITKINIHYSETFQNIMIEP